MCIKEWHKQKKDLTSHTWNTEYQKLQDHTMRNRNVNKKQTERNTEFEETKEHEFNNKKKIYIIDRKSWSH